MVRAFAKREGLGPILTTATAAPLPSDTAGEGMASLLAWGRTTLFHATPSGSSLVVLILRQTGVGPTTCLVNWGSSFSRRRRTDAASAPESSVPPSQPAWQPNSKISWLGRPTPQRML